ncbi:IclR family transcriptional regulator [Williamsia sp. 1138]|uniref:IclR family transcriptional regulator n=1 Tax=Gordonia rubripertincta TaxID=36822 RepID=A0ABT4MTR3_GORRU|nr:MULTISPECIES: IclR family transcriptional regulator [Mycobacteriales]MCZ4550401.1 IclR family transcriptional regulator [Gordonia rubripertincta]OZG26724.1 IclR family transcriptional regulator [Williamsia sp. 1138]
MTEAENETRPASIQSVDRALQVLEILAREGQGGVSEIADTLGVHKSTVSRLVSVLEARGFVEQLADRGKYRLGFTLVRLAGATMATRDLGKESRDVCEPLAAEVGETVNLAILEGDRAINITESSGPSGIALRTWVGQSSPAHATSSGKALLAALTDRELSVSLDETLERFTDRTIVDRGALVEELHLIAARGWSGAVEELEEGLNAIAAPVRDHTSDVVAALSISGPSFRLTPETMESLAPRIRDAALEVSRRIGFPG